jgi:uncharacterized coiled-coil DUF342 family protein
MKLAPGAICCVMLLLPMASAVPRHDPLTPAEIDQLRDTAQEPDQRLKLYVKFARARLASLEQVRSDPKVTDRGQETHDRLQDFLDLYDELNDNIDTYADRKEDLRKALKPIIEADTEFEAKLRALKNSGSVSKEELSHYEFLLTNTIDTLDNSAQDHRQLLSEQEEAAKHRKKSKTEPQ